MTYINYSITQNRYCVLQAVLAGNRKFYLQAAMRDVRSSLLKAGYVTQAADGTMTLTERGAAAMHDYELDQA